MIIKKKVTKTKYCIMNTYHISLSPCKIGQYRHHNDDQHDR